MKTNRSALLFLPWLWASIAGASPNPPQPSAPSPGAEASTAVFDIEPGPTIGPADEAVRIGLSGLPPGERVRLTASRYVYSSVLGGKRLIFKSEAWFKVGAAGTLDLASAVPEKGSSYAGADLHGLFWSMVPTEEPVPADAKPGRVRLLAEVAEVAGRPAAEATIELVQSLPEVRIEPIAAFPGALLASLPGEGKKPVIVLLGGAEGGAKAAREEAPKLASLGFAVLGLPYYSPARGFGGEREIPELPADFAEIPVDRLGAVYEWIKSRPDLDSERVGLYGASKGAELALLAASRFAWVKSVVAVAPSDVVWEGWGWGVAPGTRSSFSWEGKPLPFVPYVDFFREILGGSPDGEIHIRRPHDRGRAAHPAEAVAARIPVERYAGPLLLIAGQDDQLWNAGMMAHNIAERRAEAKLETVAWIYSDAGHYLNGDGWSPTTHFNLGQEKSGGTPAGNARARIDARIRMVDFLRRTLGPGR